MKLYVFFIIISLIIGITMRITDNKPRGISMATTQEFIIGNTTTGLISVTVFNSDMVRLVMAADEEDCWTKQIIWISKADLVDMTLRIKGE